MESDAIPSGDEMFSRLEPLLIVIRQAFEAGTQQAREYFENREEPVEPYLFADMTRYCAVQYLRTHHQALAEYVQQELNNNGVGLVAEDCYLRVWKARHSRGEKKGHVPAAGHSQSRQAFLSQYIQLHLFQSEDGFDDALRTVHLNLVTLWDVDRKYRLSELRLVMPKHGSVYQTTVHWDIVVPNPIYSMAADAEAQQPYEADDDLGDTIQSLDEDEGESATGQGE